MVSSTSARSDSTRPWFSIGLTRHPTSNRTNFPLTAHISRCITYTYTYEDMYKFTRIAKRGRNFTVVATVVSTGITRVGGDPYITHFVPHGIRKESPSGDSSYGWIRHMAGVMRRTPSQGLTRAKIRSTSICHTGVSPF